MSLIEKLQSIKTNLTSLLTYANGVTGQNDTDLGDAIMTLANGFGGGASDSKENEIINKSISGSYRNDNVTTVGAYVFNSCTDLTSVDFPKVVSVLNNAFINCSKLEMVNFPEVVNINNLAFANCTNLISADFPKVSRLGNGALSGCTKLTVLVLRRTDKVCTNESYSSSSDPKNTNLKIYVPRDLLESYKVATNWVRLADEFVALEDYTVDGTTTGEMNRDSDGNIIART